MSCSWELLFGNKPTIGKDQGGKALGQMDTYEVIFSSSCSTDVFDEEGPPPPSID